MVKKIDICSGTLRMLWAIPFVLLLLWLHSCRLGCGSRCSSQRCGGGRLSSHRCCGRLSSHRCVASLGKVWSGHRLGWWRLCSLGKGGHLHRPVEAVDWQLHPVPVVCGSTRQLQGLEGFPSPQAHTVVGLIGASHQRQTGHSLLLHHHRSHPVLPWLTRLPVGLPQVAHAFSPYSISWSVQHCIKNAQLGNITEKASQPKDWKT